MVMDGVGDTLNVNDGYYTRMKKIDLSTSKLLHLLKNVEEPLWDGCANCKEYQVVNCNLANMNQPELDSITGHEPSGPITRARAKCLQGLITKLFAQEAEEELDFKNLGVDLKELGINKQPYLFNLLQAYEQVD